MPRAYILVLSAAGGFVLGLFGIRAWDPFSSLGTQDPRTASGSASDAAFSAPGSLHPQQKQALLFSLLEKPRDHSRDREFYDALQNLTAAELSESAARMIATLKELAEKQRFSEQVGEVWMERWLQADTPAALQFLESTRIFDQLDPDGKWKESFAIWSLPFHGVFKAVARKDPEWTRKFLLTIKDDSKRDFGVHLLATAAAQTSGPAAKNLIADFMYGENRKAAVGGYVKGLAQSSPSDAFQVALAESPGPFRDEAMQHVLWAGSTGGSGAIRDLLDRIDDPIDRARMAGIAIGNVAYRAGENVRPWLEEEMKRAGPDGTQKAAWGWDWAIQETIRVGNHAEIAEWGLNSPVDKSRAILKRSLNDWVSSDLPAVQSWLARNAAHFDAGLIKTLDQNIQYFVEHNPHAAAKWADSLPAGALRSAVELKAALATAGAGDSTQIVALYPSLSAKDSSGAVEKRVATILCKADGQKAGAWALSLPPGKPRETALRVVADEWGQRDPVAVAEWLGEIPAGPERDGAIAEYAAKITYADPSAGADWVLEVESEAGRQKAAEGVDWTWRNENPVAAAAWIRQLPGVSETWRHKTLRVRP